MIFIRHYLNIAEDAPDKGFSGQKSAWHSSKGMPQSITYKLKHNAVICKISFYRKEHHERLELEQFCPKDFKIEGSYDGSIFVLLKHVEGKEKISGMVFTGNRPMSHYSF